MWTDDIQFVFQAEGIFPGQDNSKSLLLCIYSQSYKYGRVLGPGTYFFYFVGYLEISTYYLENSTKYLENSTY